MTPRRRPAVILGLCLAAALLVPALPAAGADRTRPDGAGTVWLCRPGQADDPCTTSLRTTVIAPDGARHVVDLRPAADPPVDCFYVYPNITLQTGANADLRVDAQETAIAQLEASPFSQVCRVFAPMYREATGRATGTAAQRSSEVAFDSVLGAWNDYLAHFNDGRGVALIGHSEGSYELAQLLTEHIDRVPAVRRLLVSAIVTGLDLPVDRVGSGPLTTIGPCRSATETGCVVDYNAFAGTPPPDSRFGKFPEPDVDGHAVVDICTNPADLAGGRGDLDAMFRTRLATQQVAGSMTEGVLATGPPSSATPWVEYEGGYSAECVTRHGFHVLEVQPIGRAPALTATPDATWGLHVDDPNLAMGNLVGLVRSESAAYLAAQRTAGG